MRQVANFFLVSHFVMERLAFVLLLNRESEKCIQISQLLKSRVVNRNATMLRGSKRKKNVCYVLIISIVQSL